MVRLIEGSKQMRARARLQRRYQTAAPGGMNLNARTRCERPIAALWPRGA
jgi:hypothetical protein